MDPTQPAASDEALPPAIPQPDGGPGIGRWWLHLLILTSYPLIMGILGALLLEEASGPALSSDLLMLMISMGGELVFFGIFFLLAWTASRVNPSQLYMRGGSVGGMIGRGLAYSVGLRLLTIGFTLVVAVGLKMTGAEEGALAGLAPNLENLIDSASLVEHPIFLLANMTVVSFIMGGLREELWRAGMLAGMLAVFPRMQTSWKGKLWAVTVIAILFGLGHLPQGWGGVIMTTLIGWGLGLVMVWRRSMWEAALAHGFFNATSFLLLYLIARFQPNALGLL